MYWEEVVFVTISCPNGKCVQFTFVGNHSGTHLKEGVNTRAEAVATVGPLVACGGGGVLRLARGEHVI